jgi:hypothetical protein
MRQLVNGLEMSGSQRRTPIDGENLDRELVDRSQCSPSWGEAESALRNVRHLSKVDGGHDSPHFALTGSPQEASDAFRSDLTRKKGDKSMAVYH